MQQPQAGSLGSLRIQQVHQVPVAAVLCLLLPAAALLQCRLQLCACTCRTSSPHKFPSNFPPQQALHYGLRIFLSRSHTAGHKRCGQMLR